MKRPLQPSVLKMAGFVAGVALVVALVLALVANRESLSPPQGADVEPSLVNDGDTSSSVGGVQAGPPLSLPVDAPKHAKAPASQPTGPSLTDDLRAWLHEFERLDQADRAASLTRGLELAKNRSENMRTLIRSNPEEALRQAVRWGEWERMPAEVRSFVEKPFSEVVDCFKVPICPGPGNSVPGIRSGTSVTLEFSDGSHFEGFVESIRERQGSKKGQPLQGIALDGLAAVRGAVFQKLTSEEVTAVRGKFGSGQSDLGKSFATGARIEGEPVMTVAGGKLFAFADESELEVLNTSLAKVDSKSGPYAGSSAIFALPYSTDGSGNSAGFNLEAAQMAAADAEKTWTTSPKRVFLIRVDFPDLQGGYENKSSLEAVINGATNDALVSMSYGHTSVSGTVSANVYRLSGGTASYAGYSSGSTVTGTFSSNSNELYSAGTSTFTQAKFGADATVNLASYDVVGIVFPDIGCYTSGVKYAGLATIGAGKMWIQGTSDPKVYVHEMGHVYGLGHSNFWQTDSSSLVVGAGQEKEYGDIYDVMGSGDLPNGHFHPQAKARLYWLEQSQWTEAAGSQTYRIFRHDDALTTGSLRGVRIPKLTVGGSQGVNEYYWVGYRAAYTDNARLSRGAYMLWQRPNEDKSCLLDMTPLTSGDKSDASLDIGMTYSDAISGIHVTPIAAGFAGNEHNKYLDVRINVGSFTSNSAPQLSGGITGSGSVYARTAATFTVASSDPDNDTLSYSWDTGDGVISGGTGLSGLTYVWTMGGTYNLTVKVSDMKGGVVSAGTSVVVIDPAQKFTSRASGTDESLYSVAASNSLLVAVGAATPTYPHVIRTSPDGVNWTARPVSESTLNLRLKSVIWDGSRFVAAGEDFSFLDSTYHGVIYTSATGLDWTRVYSSPDSNTSLGCVVSGGTLIFAGGNSKTLLKSTNGGGTWSSAGGSVPFQSGAIKVGGLAYGGGLFALASCDSSGYGYTGGGLYTSSNGSTWTDQTAGTGLSATTDFRSIQYANNRFIASGWFSKLRSSTAVGGTLTFSTNRLGYEEAPVLAYTSGLYFAAGVERTSVGSSTTTKPVNLYSMDGLVWAGTAATCDASTLYARNAGVIFNNRIVTVGERGQILQSDILNVGGSNQVPVITSSSLVVGSTLSARSKLSFSVAASDANGDALFYHWDAGSGTTVNTGSSFSHKWMAGGTYTVSVTVNDGKGGVITGTQRIVVTDPLQSFSKRASGTAEHLRGIAASGSLVVAVGNNGVVKTSSDGTTWAARTVPNLSTKYSSPLPYLNSVIFDGNRFIAVGQAYVDGRTYLSGVVFKSTDGITWTGTAVASSGTTFLSGAGSTSLLSVASSGSLIVAGGYSGTLVRSADGGVTWSPVTSVVAGTNCVVALAYGDSTFVMATRANSSTESPQVYSSRDGGVTWVERTSGAGFSSYKTFQSLACLSDRFIGIGFYSGLKSSVDAGSHFFEVSPDQAKEQGAFKNRGLAYGNGVFFATDFNNTAGKKVHQVSTDGVSWAQLDAPSSIDADENAAVFFKDSFIVVGNSGLIAQSGTVPKPVNAFEILAQPASQTVGEGNGATFSVNATGFGALSYQWKKEGVAILNATQASYSVSSASVADAGSYSVTIKDAFDGSTLTSGSAALTVQRSGTNLVNIQPPSSVAMVKSSSVSAGVTVTPGSQDSVVQTYYGLYALGTVPTLIGSVGIVPSSGVLEVPLKSVTSTGNYFVRITRSYSDGIQITSDTNSFVVNLSSWDSAAGTYEALLVSGTSNSTALEDEAVYRGLLSVTLSRTGSVSGKLLYNEASPVLSGSVWVSGKRSYKSVSRPFSGAMTLKQRGTLIYGLSSKLGVGSQSGRQTLNLEMDLSSGVPTFNATVLDAVSTLSAGTCTSYATGVSKVASALGSLSSLAGKYLMVTNGGSPESGNEHNAYVVAQVLSSAKVFWTSRLKGYSGSGSATLNLNDTTRPVAQFYEGRTYSMPTLLNATSLLGQMSFTQVSGGNWKAALGTDLLDGGLEKQSSYLKQVAYVPLWDDSLDSGTWNSGVKTLNFSLREGGRWGALTGTSLATFFPQSQPLALAIQDLLLGGSLSWSLTVSSSGVVTSTPQAPNTSPLSLRLDRMSGVFTGSYVLNNQRRTLVGVAIDSGTVSILPHVGRGWGEAGSPAVNAGSWELIKVTP